jgi:hypothetical protein
MFGDKFLKTRKQLFFLPNDMSAPHLFNGCEAHEEFHPHSQHSTRIGGALKMRRS